MPYRLYRARPCLRREGRLDKAIADADRGHPAQSETARRLRSRGLVYYKKGDFDKAIADIARPFGSIRNMPTHTITEGSLREEGRSRQGHRRLYRGHPLDPKDAKAYLSRGTYYKKEGRPAKADADFAQAKELGYKGK